MGRLEKGFNGGFRGKVGKVVGSSWRDLEYIRSVPKRSSVPATEKQLMQQARFALTVKFLQPLKEILYLGYMNEKAGRATGYNMAVKDTINRAIAGSYPNYQLDYAQVVMSKGGLAKPLGVVFSAANPAEISLAWAPVTNELNARVDDRAVVVLYNETQDAYMASVGEQLRQDGAILVTVPALFAGDTLHAWLFFTSHEQNRCSESVYAGTVTVL